MNDTEAYIFNTLKTWVWSGFYSLEDVFEMVEELAEDEYVENGEHCDEDLLQTLVEEEFAKKEIAEDTWDEFTDCDRLDLVFKTLSEQGIIAIQNAGFDIDESLEYVSEIFEEIGDEGIIGYCFYHEQDIEHAINHDALFLAFGELSDDVDNCGEIIINALKEQAFQVNWNGSAHFRIEINPFNWQRRLELEDEEE